MLAISLLGAWAMAAPPTLRDACQGESTPGGRQLQGTIVQVNSTDDCRALCCADSAAHPIPIVGIHPTGCVAWFARVSSHKDKQSNTTVTSGQCFMAPGVDRHGKFTVVPDVNKTYCKPSDPKRAEPDCATGVVQPTMGPKPPTPPAVFTNIGAEGSAQYVDAAFDMKLPAYANGTNKPLNASTELAADGWPLMDCQITIFDHRPVHAWAPPMDDPKHYQEDYSGEWTLTLTGNATIELVSPVGISLGAPTYNAATNQMVQPIIFAKGEYPAVQNLLQLRFLNTRATPDSPAKTNGTGFRDLRILRPGYAATTTQLFTDNWAALMKTYSRLRWMGATGTNGYSWRCAPPNAASCSVVQWHERRQPNQSFPSAVNGLPPSPTPWEHVLLAANELDSDVWINVPLQASAPTVCRSDPNGDHTACIKDDPTSTYEYQLALLFRDGNSFTGNVGLKPHLKIYVEHSNEVWNFGFKQEGMNQNFAEWEVLNASAFPSSVPQGPTNLDHTVPGHPDIEERQQCSNRSFVVPPDRPGKPPSKGSFVGAMCWGRRRHARRVYEIAKTFEKVFGAGSLDHDTGRIRPIYASWGLEHNFQTYYNDTLLWLEAEYGDISKFLYGISYAQYFGPHSQNECTGTGANAHCTSSFNYSTATVPQVIAAYEDAAVQQVPETAEFVAMAKKFKLKTASYEGGPGYKVGGELPGTQGLDTMIAASRDAGMKTAIIKQVQLTWQFGWDDYNYFVGGAGLVKEYGCWGITESWADINPGPPKLQALYELTGHSPDVLAEWARGEERERAQRFV